MSAVFCFHIKGDEKGLVGREKGIGLGHANRCLALAREWESLTGEAAVFMINSTKAALGWVEERGYPFYLEDEVDRVIRETNPSVLFFDINYLEPVMVEPWRNKALICNVAPRGEIKYANLLNYLDTAADVDEARACFSDAEILTGPDYAVIGDAFRAIRARIDLGERPWKPRAITVAMGGSDPWNFTTLAISCLKTIPLEFDVRVVIGPYFSFEEELRAAIDSSGRMVEVLHNPTCFAELVAESTLCLLAGGITMFEALSVGVPSWNLCPTPFHLERCRELETGGLIFDSTLDRDYELRNWACGIETFLSDESKIQTIRSKAIQTVDGRGATRIIRDVIERRRAQAISVTF